MPVTGMLTRSTVEAASLPFAISASKVFAIGYSLNPPSTRAVNPMRSTAAVISSVEAFAPSNLTCAQPTSTESTRTPSTPASAFVTRRAQASQCIPSMDSLIVFSMLLNLPATTDACTPLGYSKKK
jgi:hypothetical protein